MFRGLLSLCTGHCVRMCSLSLLPATLVFSGNQKSLQRRLLLSGHMTIETSIETWLLSFRKNSQPKLPHQNVDSTSSFNEIVLSNVRIKLIQLHRAEQHHYVAEVHRTNHSSMVIKTWETPGNSQAKEEMRQEAVSLCVQLLGFSVP